MKQALNSKPLQKVSPNTQEIDKAAADTSNASQVLSGNISTTWGDLLFAYCKDVLIALIVQYSISSPAMVAGEIELAGNEAATIIKTNAGGNKTATPDDEIAYLKDQRNNILHYLPAALQLGALLDDDTLDDHTHKMDGPVSGLMHAIEKAFSGTPPAES